MSKLYNLCKQTLQQNHEKKHHVNKKLIAREKQLKKWYKDEEEQQVLRILGEWVKLNKYNNITGPDMDEINYIMEKRQISFTDVYKYLIQNSIHINIPNSYKDFIKWYINPSSKITDDFAEFMKKYPEHSSLSYFVMDNLQLVDLRILEWVNTLSNKVLTNYDIKKYIEKEGDIYMVKDIHDSLHSLYLKVPMEISYMIFIRKQKPTTMNKQEQLDSFYKKYNTYYKAINNHQTNITQTAGAGLDCHNTQVLLNRIGSCWNTSIQSIYAFYIDDFIKIIKKTGAELYKDAEDNHLIEYLPQSFRDKKDLVIEMLDSISKRWHNKKNKKKNLFEFQDEDTECEIKSIGLFVKELMNDTSITDITEEGLYHNIGGDLHYIFFISLIFNVFYCKEIFDFFVYGMNIQNLIPIAEYLPSDNIKTIFDKSFIENSIADDNLIGVNILSSDHSTAIVKCNDSKYGHFNNYYDDNYRKIYTLDYKEFIDLIVNTLIKDKKNINKLYEIDLIKPTDSKMKLVITDIGTGKRYEKNTTMYNKYMKYKLKYMKYKTK